MSDADRDLPAGVPREPAERIAGALIELYPSPDVPDIRHGATKFLIYQAVGTMITAGAREPDAAQTVVAAVMELLVDGLGHAGASAHLRRMADSLDRDAPVRH